MATITDTWDSTFEASPANGDLISQGDDKIRQLKQATSERGRREHYWTPGSNNAKHGMHLPGSAIAYVQSAAPTNNPAGDALSADDKGRIWIDEDDDLPYYYDGSSMTPIKSHGEFDGAITAQPRVVTHYLIAGSSTYTSGELFTALNNSPAGDLPNGTYFICHGSGYSTNVIVLYLAQKVSSTRFTLYGSQGTPTYVVNADSGSGSSTQIRSLAW